MLSAMRKQASSWVVKVLLGVLIVSFAVWGIGDIFLGSGDSAVVAEVGDLEVDVRDVNRELEQQMAQLRQMLGGAIDREQAMAFGLLNRSVQTEVAERLVDMHGRDLGIGVDDAQIREAIRQNAAFAGVGGFDRGMLDMFLRSQGMTEAELIDEVRDEIKRTSLLQAMTGIAPVPAALTEKVFRYRSERRRATALIALPERHDIADPDDATLQTYLDDNQAAFQAPEYRRGVVIQLEPDWLADEIEIDPARSREMYQARIAEFSTPETRELAQLLAPDEAVAGELVEALEQGAVFAELVEAFPDRGVSYSTIGPIRENELPGELGEPAFALQADAISAPIESDFGYHIFKVIAINEGRTQPYEDVRPLIDRELALNEANRTLPDLSASLDDEIAAGQTLELAAETLNLPLTVVDSVDRQGFEKGSDSPTPIDLPREILEALFSAEPGEASLLEETSSGGYFVYRVDEIEESRPLTLAEARDDVLAAWRDDQQSAAAVELAESIRQQVAGGATLEELAQRHGDLVRLTTTDPLLRSDTGSMFGLDNAAVSAIFDVAAGAVVEGTFDVPAGSVILRTDEIIDAELPDDLDAVSREVGQQMRNDLLAQYEANLRRRYHVEINERALAAFASPDQAAY